MPEVVNRTGSPGRGTSELPGTGWWPRSRKNPRNVSIVCWEFMAGPFRVGDRKRAAGLAMRWLVWIRVTVNAGELEPGDSFPVAWDSEKVRQRQPAS